MKASVARVLAFTIIVSTALIPSVSHAAAAVINTEFKDPVTGRVTTRSVPYSTYAPTFIDVDDSTATGGNPLLPGADVQIRLTPVAIALGVQVQFDRLEVTRSLPLRVEIVYPYSGSSTFMIGFDARTTTAPTSLSAQFTTGGMLSPSVDVSLNQADGGDLKVFGELYDEAADGSHDNPKAATISLAPVPASFTASIGSTIVNSGTGRVAFTASTPTTMVLTGASLDGVYTERFGFTVDRLPGSLSLDSTVDQVTGDGIVTYNSSAPIGRVGLSYSKRTPARILEVLTGTLLDMPTQATVRTNDEGNFSITANAAVGMIAFGTSTSSDPTRNAAVATLPDADYAYAAQDGAYRSLALQIHGLTELSIGNQVPEGFQATLDAARVPFRAVMWEKDRHDVRIAIDRLPDRMTISSDLSTSFSYSATDVIGELDVKATDLAGLNADYTYLHTRLTDLPTSLTVTFGGTNGEVALDTGGPVIGNLELVMSQTPGFEVFPWDVRATGDWQVGQTAYPVEGVLLWDAPGILPNMMSARIGGLQRASAKIVGDVTTVQLRTNGRPRFMVEVWDADEYIHADLQGLAPVVDITTQPFGGGQQIIYNASSAQNLLWMQTGTYSGSEYTVGQLSGPLPAFMDIRTGVDEQNKLYFDASEHTNVYYWSSNGSSVTNGWVKHLRVGSGGGGSSGWFEIDTDNIDMHGKFVSGSTELDVRRNLRAQDKYVRWQYYVPTSERGSMDCDDVHVKVGGVSMKIDWLC